MKNIEVIKAFLNLSEGNSHNKNLISIGDRLFSYNTCIAEWTDDYLLINVTKYSQSTSRIQNMLLREARTGLEIIKVDNVPINIQRLWIDEMV